MERLSDLISAKQAGLRLRRMQKICDTSGLDALLFIAGMDGKYHAGTQQALNYLFCGHSGRDVVDGGKLPGCLEDAVLVLTKDGISVFCHEQSYSELVKLIIPSGEANIVCPSREEAEDPDAYEELKIAAFVQLLRNHRRVGVPLSVEMRDGQLVHEVREVDTWPLVQAYGLEGVGKPGFFTQNFLVESIQKQVQQAYCELDALAVEQLLQHNVANMKQHWHELALGIAEMAPSCLTELSVASPLLSFFMHGTIRDAVEVRQVVSMPPRVLFGSNTNDTTRKSSSTKVADVPISRGHPCLHMTLEAADPKSPIRVARTFFLTRAALVADVFAGGDLAGASSGSLPLQCNPASSHDLQQLTQLYAALVDAAKVAMHVFATQEGATTQTARAAAVQELLLHSPKHGVPLSEADLEQNLHVALWSSDHTNRVSGQARQYSRKVKVLRVSLLNIRSAAPQHPGVLLGAVTYADTFVEVEGGFGEAPQLLVLTSSIPMCKFFSCDLAEARSAAAAHRNLASWLGQAGQASAAAAAPSTLRSASNQHSASTGPSAPLGALLSTGGGEEAIIYTGAPLLPAVPGFVRFFSSGLAFSSRTTNLLAIDLQRDVTSISVQHMECREHGLPAIGEALVLRGRSSACSLAPACFMTDAPYLVLPLASLSPMNKRQLLVKVLPVWQQTCREAGVAWEKDIQPGTPFAVELYPQQYFMLPSPKKRWPLQSMDATVEQALQRLDRLELAAAYPPDPDVEGILLRSPAHGPEGSAARRPCLAATTATMALSAAPESTVSVILVAGLPGADQHIVAGALSDMVGDGACILLHHPSRGAAIDMEVLEQDLVDAIAALRGMPGPCATLILTTACYSAIASQLQVLARTRPFRDGACLLAAVITSVATSSFYEDDSCCQCLPGTLEQASPGLVDLIVLSGTKHASRVQALLYLHNPHAPIVRASWPAIAQAASKLISSQADRLSKLQDPMLAQQRHCSSASAAASPRGLLCGSLQCVWMQFSGSLDLELLRSRLADLGGTSSLSESSSAQRKVPLEVCGPDETSVHAVYFSGLLRLEQEGSVKEVTARRGKDAVVKGYAPGNHQGLSLSALRQPDGSEPGGEVLVVGAGVTASKISSLLQSCLTQPPEDSRDASATLTAGELHAIQEQHRFDPLPEGYYFTGSSYVDPFGACTQNHPCMEQFIAQYVLQVEQQSRANQAAYTTTNAVQFRVVDVSEVCLGP